MSEPDESTKRIGTTLRGKWTLERTLGKGGMATVYAGMHKIGRRDAIKILHPEYASIPEVRARFEQEAHAVNRFRHPGAVEIRDIDVTDDGAPFLVMEMLEGEPLSTKLRRDGALPPDKVLAWADELLDVLAAAHAQGIIHRDIKPDNLFVQNDGRLKVLDFGIARVRSGAAKRMKTETGKTIGTVSYMAPEQARGVEIDGRADLFSVGATMFRMLANRRVHEADSDFERLKKVATEPAPPLASAMPGAPPHVCAVVDRALAFDREQRYPDAATMQADVRAAMRGEPPPFATARATENGAPTVAPRDLHVSPAAVSAPAPAPAPAHAPGWEPTQTHASAPWSVPDPVSAPAASAPPQSVTRPAENAPTRVVGYASPTRVDATLVSPSDKRGRAFTWILLGGGALIVLVVVAVAALFLSYRRLAGESTASPEPSASAAGSPDDSSTAATTTTTTTTTTPTSNPNPTPTPRTPPPPATTTTHSPSPPTPATTPPPPPTPVPLPSPTPPKPHGHGVH